MTARPGSKRRGCREPGELKDRKRFRPADWSLPETQPGGYGESRPERSGQHLAPRRECNRKPLAGMRLLHEERPELGHVARSAGELLGDREGPQQCQDSSGCEKRSDNLRP